MSPIHLPFPSQLITSNFSSILIIFCLFFTWIAPSNADLRFRLILVTKANAVEEGTVSSECLYHHCNQSIHLTDGMTGMSFSAILQHKKSAARGCLCQIVLNQSHAKRNRVRKDLPVPMKIQVMLYVSAIHCYTCSDS